MRNLVFALTAILTAGGCTQVKNPLHCTYTDAFCADNDASTFCNIYSGRCVLPLEIERVTPAIPIPTSTTATIIGKGFQDIASIKVNDTEVLKFASIQPTAQIDIDLVGLRNAPEAASLFTVKCGPVPITITRKDELSTTAYEMIGRSFSRWKYQKPMASASAVVDFSFELFANKKFDGIYYDNTYVTSLLNGSLKSKSINLNEILQSKIVFANIGTDAQPKQAFALQVNASLSLGILGGLAELRDASVLCGPGRQLLDYSPFTSANNKILSLSCLGSVASYSMLSIKQLDFAIRIFTPSVSNYKFAKSVRSVSFAPNDADCGVALLSPTDPAARSSLAPVCKNMMIETNAESPSEVTLMGVAQSVASVNSRDAATISNVTRHYILSKNNESLVMEVFDVSRPQGGVTPPLISSSLPAPIEFNIKDTGPFSAFGAKIEVNDLNCDKFQDIIVKTDSRVIAYLGINDTSWESTPRVLFEMPSTAPGITINKAALWIPDYSMPQALGVLGILDSTGNLALYQQQ